MKQVAKVLIIDSEDRYLLMKRSDHPYFLNDPDLPGGTIEGDEAVLEAAIREVREETGISLNSVAIQRIYTGSEYAAPGTKYSLYVAHVTDRPTVAISWEHASFAWVSREEFLKQARDAVDPYMHMVHSVVSGN